MVNNLQYNKNYYLTICICMSLGSGMEQRSVFTFQTPTQMERIGLNLK